MIVPVEVDDRTAAAFERGRQLSRERLAEKLTPAQGVLDFTAPSVVDIQLPDEVTA